ncbi:large ribosomal subunit protein bL9-like [Ruditapes philippinarum]|uniref:large ribosomal subunit protein bL9-like n=1 Tax=Ruditapes philippinarum TaxID=129788 RepID=UPI00295ACBD8|nr:large ribosomal subunit protein bL9-like [Ruditapes philippinarum]
MEVILKSYIQKLGYANDIVEVKPGYGRNYLIPKGYAILATEANKKIVAENARQAAHKEAKLRQDAEAIAEKITNTTLEIGAKTGEKGKIFGSITPAQIAEKLKSQGFNIDRKQIFMKDSPKELKVKETGNIRPVKVCGIAVKKSLGSTKNRRRSTVAFVLATSPRASPNLTAFFEDTKLPREE